MKTKTAKVNLKVTLKVAVAVGGVVGQAVGVVKKESWQKMIVTMEIKMKTKKNGGVRSAARHKKTEKLEKKVEEGKLWSSFSSKTESLPLTPTQTQTQTSMA